MNKYQYVCENYKKPLPILFNTEMVQAILKGRKFQTRRNPFFFKFRGGHKPEFSGYSLGEYCTGAIVSGAVLYSRRGDGCWTQVTEREKPPYVPGDILYVRETWKATASNEKHNMILVKYITDKYSEWIEFAPDRFKKFEKYASKNGNHPNIFMPYEASRIFLKVTDVRVERVQDITEEGVKTEGIEYPVVDTMNRVLENGYRLRFSDLWNKLYISKGYGWDLNPWVWIIEFEKMNIEKS